MVECYESILEISTDPLFSDAFRPVLDGYTKKIVERD